MWWPLLQSLAEHYKADANLSGLQVNYGLRVPVPEQDSIDVRYGGSPGFDLHEAVEGTDRIWVDVLKKLSRDDAATAFDTGIAYQQLYELTERVLDSTREWFRGAAVSDLASFNATVEELRGDGEALRDDEIAASRIILHINWRK